MACVGGEVGEGKTDRTSARQHLSSLPSHLNPVSPTVHTATFFPFSLFTRTPPFCSQLLLLKPLPSTHDTLDPPHALPALSLRA